MARYRVAIANTPKSDHGYLLNEDNQSFYGSIWRITRRVLDAMQLPQATSGLTELSRGMKQEFRLDYDVTESVQDFQSLLEKARTDPEAWPTLMIDFQMGDETTAGFHRFPDNKRPFDIQREFISLNGLRVYLHWQDWNDKNPEFYPRWYELFTSYCHEVAHMFVTYLAVTYRGMAEVSTPKKFKYAGDEDPEAGCFLEHSLFGGRNLRRPDTSNRTFAFMPGLPIVDVTGVTKDERAVSLEAITRLVEKPIIEPYQESDLQIQTSPPESDSSESSPNDVRYKKWWQEFREMFGRDFAIPVDNGTHQDTGRFPNLLSTVMGDPERHVYLPMNPWSETAGEQPRT